MAILRMLILLCGATLAGCFPESDETPAQAALFDPQTCQRTGLTQDSDPAMVFNDPQSQEVNVSMIDGNLMKVATGNTDEVFFGNIEEIPVIWEREGSVFGSVDPAADPDSLVTLSILMQSNASSGTMTGLQRMRHETQGRDYSWILSCTDR